MIETVVLGVHEVIVSLLQKYNKKQKQQDKLSCCFVIIIEKCFIRISMHHSLYISYNLLDIPMSLIHRQDIFD
ncbi:hypothetical protein, partial [Dysgonomonas sp. UBA7698]|uniref:hypothetical protein n=1 Tax=Dysgonomonas sp. UBA7698 TaxID=1946427 RepID=UPI0025C0B966